MEKHLSTTTVLVMHLVYLLRGQGASMFCSCPARCSGISG
jgi:hypothetical protein